MIEWNQYDSAGARNEGWDLYTRLNGTHFIQRIERAAFFKDDQEAHEHVIAQNTPLHHKAIAIVAASRLLQAPRQPRHQNDD